MDNLCTYQIMHASTWQNRDWNLRYRLSMRINVNDKRLFCRSSVIAFLLVLDAMEPKGEPLSRLFLTQVMTRRVTIAAMWRWGEGVSP